MSVSVSLSSFSSRSPQPLQAQPLLLLPPLLLHPVLRVPVPTQMSLAAYSRVYAAIGPHAQRRLGVPWVQPSLGSIGNAAQFVSEGAAGGGAGGGFPPCGVFETVLVLSLLLFPPPLPPAPTLAAEADHAVLRTPRLRTAGVGPVFGGCGAWGGVALCDRGCCCCGCC